MSAGHYALDKKMRGEYYSHHGVVRPSGSEGMYAHGHGGGSLGPVQGGHPGQGQGGHPGQGQGYGGVGGGHGQGGGSGGHGPFVYGVGEMDSRKGMVSLFRGLVPVAG